MAGADLHIHSTASDGTHAPADVVRLAAEAGLETIALTDHDTLAGVAAAAGVGGAKGVRVIAGAEFSVAAPWGEMHLLGYFLPPDDARLARFLAGQREARGERMREIVRRLQRSGVRVSLEAVQGEAGGDALGRPHAARALVRGRHVASLAAAFDQYLGRGRPAFVPKVLPDLATVTALAREVGGVTSAAHLRGRGTRPALERLRDLGVDAVEVRHPAHDAERAERLDRLAGTLGLLRSGGTDWHGEEEADEEGRAHLGAVTIPPAWVAALEALHRRRTEGQGGVR